MSIASTNARIEGSVATAAGFRLDSSIRDERSVVMPQFGLIGCAMLHTRPENEPRVAEVAAQVKGVDFAAYEKQGIVYVAGRDSAPRHHRTAR